MNLNLIKLTKKSLFSKISDIDVYRYYIDSTLDFNATILSPLREESMPSFGFFVGKEGDVCFNDFVLNVSGDAVKFIQLLFNLNFGQALNKIALDFNLDNVLETVGSKSNTGRILPKVDQSAILEKLKTKVVLGTKRRDWRFQDFAFWDQFGISLWTLKKYNVIPLAYYIINDKVIKSDEYAYAYRESKNNIITCKIYQPYNTTLKWMNSHDESVIQGWNQLPFRGELLIITKSLKDVMAIVENTGIPAIALQSEKIKLNPKVIEELKRRFKRIIILYDNDYDKETNWGKLFGEKMSKDTGFPFYMFDSKYECKDFSDLIKKYGIFEAVEILLKLINF